MHIQVAEKEKGSCQSSVSDYASIKINYFSCIMHVVIIGNGVAGTTAARHLRKLSSDARITMISEESDYFFSRTALMYVYMGHMKFHHIKPYEDWFWPKNRIDLVNARVENIDFPNKVLTLNTTEKMSYDKLVIATGSRSRFFDWPGQNLRGVQGLYSLQDLQKMERSTPQPFQKDHPVRSAVVVGGGLIGVELAEMLLSRQIKVTMLVRENRLWGDVLTRDEGRRLGDHLRSHSVRLITETELKEIHGDTQGVVKAVETTAGEMIDCQWVGLGTGVIPNVEFLRDSDLEIDWGIVVDERLQTNIPDVYAAGDCAQIREPRKYRKAIEPVWYVGRMMGEVVGQIIGGGEQAYMPGPWFNSAKFFDIEYQVYGHVLADPSGTQKHFFFEFEPGQKFMTIAYDAETQVLEGINSFGIRLRHEVVDRWLRDEISVGDAVGQIQRANFDTEFYRKWAQPLKRTFHAETGIQPQSRSVINKMLNR